MSRSQALADDQWSLISDLLPARTGRKGRAFHDARQMVDGIVHRYRTGTRWRDLPEEFGPLQSVWTWHRRMSADGTWDRALPGLLAHADQAGELDWATSADSTTARAHQHAAALPRDTGAWSNHKNPPRRAS